MIHFHKYISCLFLLMLSFVGTAQDLNWYKNSGIETGTNNTLTGNAQVLSLEVLPEGTSTGYFEITNFKIDGNNIAGFLETRYSDVTIFLSQTSITTLDDRNAYSIKILNEGRSDDPFSSSYKVVAKKPDGSIIGTLTNIAPQTSDRLRIEKINATQIRFSYNSQVLGTVTDSNLSWLRAGYAGNLSADVFPPRVLSCIYSQQGFSITDNSYGPFSVTDTDKNWVSVNTYGITENQIGNLTGASVTYYDDIGKTTQSQVFDKKGKKTWASEIRYDHQGRPAVSTLTAPIGNAGSFSHKDGFIKKEGNANFNISDYEKEDIENPTPVTNEENTLGWYYSNSNNSDPYQDVTDRPYSRTIYSELNPGTALKTIGGNKMGDEWKQGYVFSMPAGNELSQPNAFGETKYNDYKIIKTVSRDVHGVESVVFTDTDGRTLAAARSGNEKGGIDNSRTSTVTIGEQKFVDIHIPVGLQGITVTNENFGNLSNNHWFEVYDLVSEQKITTAFGSLPSGFYRISYVASGTPTIQVTYPENYYDYSLNEYDKVGRLISSKQPLQQLESTFQYNTLGQLVFSHSPDEGDAWFKYKDDGQIRFSQNSKQKDSHSFSYTNYDQLGRPVESGVFYPKPVSDVFSNIDPNEDLSILGIRSEVHTTTYDVLSSDDLDYLANIHSSYANPSFLSGNVAKTYNENTTTYYSYDIYGRVQWIVQDIKDLGDKTIDYEYDPITSQVSRVLYQKYGTTDLFIHRYTYDKDDYSLTKVETSTDGSTYKEHAEYSYNETGALKRLNLAQGLQGIDYVYNLNGALKSINSPNLTATSDPGGDNNDLFGMNIHYYKDDYKRTGTPRTIPSTANGIEQYNGNIKAITWKTTNIDDNNPDTYYYTYNKNNWLTGASFNTQVNEADPSIQIEETRSQTVTETEDVEARATVLLKPGFNIVASSSKTFSARIATDGTVQGNGDYNVSNITYDANGNIQSLNRNKDTYQGSNAMDQLSYTYKTDKPNQLLRVDDAAGEVDGADDIGDQITLENYKYNKIGQLIEDWEYVTPEDPENVIRYSYNASGLVTEVSKKNVTLVKFFYNDKNHRVRKESYNPNSSAVSITYYVRDAAGTVMAIYNKLDANVPGGGASPQIAEHTIYGASRLGVYKRGLFGEGNSYYELTDHLGNVRAVVGRDKDNNPIAMTTATDYYPFGMPMPGRIQNGSEQYRYAYQGQEKDTETGKEAFQLRLWDSRIGRWLTTDPYGEFSSPYLGMANNPIRIIDPDGGCTSCLSFETLRGINEFVSYRTTGNPFTYLKDDFIQLDEVYLGLLDRIESRDQLDPSTVGHNIFYLTYPGGNNPLTYNGDYTYTAIPKDLSGYPAIGHDRRYDNLNIAGASGLFTDTRAIGADWKFVSEELEIAGNPVLPLKTRLYAGTLGVGLGLAALPKTLVKLAEPNGVGMMEIEIYYHLSSHGVTNAPDKPIR
ncbi:RHS repeat domain-containing protein [Aquimarina sp. 433]